MKIGIVILNYLTWEDTIECIDSIKEQNYQDYEVVVVDNFSNNSSYEILTKEYINDDNVHVIQAGANLGYAKGNNLGIKYCTDHLLVKNILILNNDTVMVTDDYLSKLNEMDYCENVGAVGTKIVGSDGLDQNPIQVSISTRQILKSIFGSILGSLGLSFSPKSKKQKPIEQKEINKSDLVGSHYILHGSAIFLTENYLTRFRGFYPETFMYFEENILALIMEKLGLKMVYNDSVYIYHKEAQTSTKTFDNYDKTKAKHSAYSTLIALKVKFSSLQNIKGNKKN